MFHLLNAVPKLCPEQGILDMSNRIFMRCADVLTHPRSAIPLYIGKSRRDQMKPPNRVETISIDINTQMLLIGQVDLLNISGPGA